MNKYILTSFLLFTGLKANSQVSTQGSIKADTSITSVSDNCQCVPKIVELGDDTVKWMLVFFPTLLFLVIIVVSSIIPGDFKFKDALSEIYEQKKIIKNPECNADSIKAVGNNHQNLFTIFPPTLEISGIYPSLYELFKMLEEKEKALELAENKLSQAVGNDRESLANAIVVLKNEVTRFRDFFEVAKEKDCVGERDFYKKPSISRYIAFVTSLITIMLIVCMTCFFIYHYLRSNCPPDFRPLTTIIIALAFGIIPYVANKIVASKR